MLQVHFFALAPVRYRCPSPVPVIRLQYSPISALLFSVSFLVYGSIKHKCNKKHWCGSSYSATCCGKIEHSGRSIRLSNFMYGVNIFCRFAVPIFRSRRDRRGYSRRYIRCSSNLMSCAIMLLICLPY